MTQPPQPDNYQDFGIDDFIDHITHLGSSPMRQDNDNEYGTPPGQELTLQDIEALSQYDGERQDNEPQDAMDPGDLFEGDSAPASQHRDRSLEGDESQADEADHGAQDEDAQGETDDEDPTSRQQGGGARDIMDPSHIIGHKRRILTTPRATRTTHMSAARRDPNANPEVLMVPESSSPFDPLQQVAPHYSMSPGGSTVLTLRFENTGVDIPEQDVHKIPLVDVRVKRSDEIASLPGITRYLIAISEGRDVEPTEFGIETASFRRSPKAASSKRGLGSREEGEASIPRDDKAGGEDDVFSAPYTQTADVSQGRAGRPSSATRDAVDGGIQLLSSIRCALADVTGVSESYIQSRWDKQKGLKPKGGIVAYGTNCPLAAGEATNNNTIAARCYESFKDLYPGKWRDILETFEELAALEGHQKTVHNRTTDWNIHRQRLVEVMEKGHEQGFETFAVSCGSNIHQDKGLGVSEESAGAVGFIADKLQMDHNDVLGHFLSFVHNKVSDDVLKETREPHKAEGTSKASKAAKPRKVEGSSKDVQPDDEPSVISIASSHDDGSKKKILDRYHLARHTFSQAAAKVGLILNVSQFPWGTLATILTDKKIRIVNYPLGIPFPGHESNKSLGKSRGITAVPAAHISSILEALAPSAKQQMIFEAIPEPEWSRPKFGVIINAAPQPDSKLTRGSTMLSDGSVVKTGPARLPYGHEQVTEDFCESHDERPSGNAKTRIKAKSKAKAKPISPSVVRSDGSDSDKADVEVVEPPSTGRTTRSGLHAKVPASKDKGKGKARAEVIAGGSSKRKGQADKVDDAERQHQRRRLRQHVPSSSDASDASINEDDDDEQGQERVVTLAKPTPTKLVRAMVAVEVPMRKKKTDPAATTSKARSEDSTVATTSKTRPAAADSTTIATTSKTRSGDSTAVTTTSKMRPRAGDSTMVTSKTRPGDSTGDTSSKSRPTPRRLQQPASSTSQDIQPYEGRPRTSVSKQSGDMVPAVVPSGVAVPLDDVSKPKEPKEPKEPHADVSKPHAPHADVSKPIRSNVSKPKEPKEPHAPHADVSKPTRSDVSKPKESKEPHTGVSKPTHSESVPHEEMPARLSKRSKPSPDAAKDTPHDGSAMRASKRSRSSVEAPSPITAQPLVPLVPPAHTANASVDHPPTPPVEPATLPATVVASPEDSHLQTPRALAPPPPRTPLMPSIDLVEASPQLRERSYDSRSHGEDRRSHAEREYRYGLDPRERQDYAYRREQEYRQGHYPHPPRSAAGSHSGSMGERRDRSLERSHDGREYSHESFNRGPSFEYRDYRDHPRSRERRYEQPDESHPPRSHERPDNEPRMPRPPHSRERPDEPRIHDYPDEPRRRPRVAFTEDDPYMHELPPVAGTSSRGHYYDRYEHRYHRYPAEYGDFNSREPSFHDPAYYYRDMRMSDPYRRGHLYPPSPPQGPQQLPSRGRSPSGRSPSRSPAPSVPPAADP